MTKYIPDPSRRVARDISGEWGAKDFQNLVVSPMYRILLTL